jgi:hypothetical protein
MVMKIEKFNEKINNNAENLRKIEKLLVDLFFRLDEFGTSARVTIMNIFDKVEIYIFFHNPIKMDDDNYYKYNTLFSLLQRLELKWQLSCNNMTINIVDEETFLNELILLSNAKKYNL